MSFILYVQLVSRVILSVGNPLARIPATERYSDRMQVSRKPKGGFFEFEKESGIGRGYDREEGKKRSKEGQVRRIEGGRGGDFEAGVLYLNVSAEAPSSSMDEP
jgi:hypothetical protein